MIKGILFDFGGTLALGDLDKEYFATNFLEYIRSLGFRGRNSHYEKARKGMFERLKKVRSILPLRDWWPILKAKLIGHYNYFGISGNMRSLQQFYSQVISMVFKWINRRSQKKSMNWRKYQRYLQWYPLPTPVIYHTIYTLSPSR